MATKAYTEGYNSYGQGLRARDNPYRSDTYSGAQWLTGWMTARQGKSRREGLEE